MSMTYTNVIKFPMSQRLFKGSDGRFYLADESADEIPYQGNRYKTIIGTPDKTDDGPLAILTDESIEAYYDDLGFNQGFHVQVEAQAHVVVERGVVTERTRVNVCIDGALYLSAHLGMTVKAANGEFRINPLPKEAS